jgi:hypothetical protein
MQNCIREIAYQCGEITELRRYRKPVIYGAKHNSDVSKGDNNAIIKSKKEIDSIVREKKRNKIRRITNTNSTGKDLIATFTFADVVPDEDLARKKFYNFIERLRYSNSNASQYIWAMERHKYSHIGELPGIHFHSVFFQWPGISEEELQDLWGLGSICTDDTENKYNLGTYFANYVTKEKENQLSGRTWNYSKNLKKPTKEIREKHSVISEESILFESRPQPNMYYGETQTLYIKS